MNPSGSSRGESLADVVERVLDKGLVINADIVVSLAGTELLGIKIRAALASFETAARYGLSLPFRPEMVAIPDRASPSQRHCTQCGFLGFTEELVGTSCPACGHVTLRGTTEQVAT